MLKKLNSNNLIKEKATYMKNLLLDKVKKVEIVSSRILFKIGKKMTQQKESMMKS